MRSTIRRTSPEFILELWLLLGLLLGRSRRRLLLIQPMLSACIAVTEVAVIVAVSRLLLSLVSGADQLTFSPAGHRVTFGYDELAAWAAGLAIASILLRVSEARFTGKMAALAIRNARRDVASLVRR